MSELSEEQWKDRAEDYERAAWLLWPGEDNRLVLEVLAADINRSFTVTGITRAIPTGPNSVKHALEALAEYALVECEHRPYGKTRTQTRWRITLEGLQELRDQPGYPTPLIVRPSVFDMLTQGELHVYSNHRPDRPIWLKGREVAAVGHARCGARIFEGSRFFDEPPGGMSKCHFCFRSYPTLRHLVPGARSSVG